MGQLNIKDEALIAEARALAEELGTSVTGALREAVRALRESRAAASQDGRSPRVEAILEIGRRVRATLPPGVSSAHDDLYDEQGLPR
jgi:antitoxin VapB